MQQSAISRIGIFGIVCRCRNSPQIVTRFFSVSRTWSQPSTSVASHKQPQLPPEPIKKWDLFAGVVLERKPVITQEMSPIEKEYSELMAKYEFELSKKSSHEIRKEKDRVTNEKIKSGELEPDQASAQTAQDEEDLWAAELNQFQPGSRKTEADKKNDQKSLKRALDSYLMFVIEQKLGKDFKWICPHGKWKEGETMRQTAERTLKETCPEIKAKVLGHAPWGFYKYRYPKPVVSSLDSPVVGAKIFFYKAQVVSGEIASLSLPQPQEGKAKSTSTGEKSIIAPSPYNDYLWLTRDELASKLHPEYHKQLCEFLIDEANN